MKKIIFAILLISCITACTSTKRTMIPRAVNTVNSIGLNELNLQRSDYEILNTVTSSATISYIENRTGTEVLMKGEDEEFTLRYIYNKKTGWDCRYSGIMKFGYLDNDYIINQDGFTQPEEIARRLAIYRIVNQANMAGADGVIEPIISTNVAQQGKSIIYQTTVSAKLIKIKTNN